MVNAMRLQSWNNAGMNIEDVINRFVSNSSPEDFCMVHRVLENFEFRTRDHSGDGGSKNPLNLIEGESAPFLTEGHILN